MSEYQLTVEQIQKYLPHRPPFLMLDRVLEIEPKGDLKCLTPATAVGIRVVAEKLVTINEPYFLGHFPGKPIMPGVLVVEAMAQAASMTLYPYVSDQLTRFADDFHVLLLGTDGVRFRKAVVPGDVLRLETVVTRCRAKIWVFQCEALVDGQKVAEAEIMANMVVSDEIFSMGVS